MKGSHGRKTDNPADGPLIMSQRAELIPGQTVEATAVYGLILAHLGLSGAVEAR